MTDSARSGAKHARKVSTRARALKPVRRLQTDISSSAASSARVRQYYDATIAHEAQRLEENTYRRIERDMTLRTITRHVPGGARILDVGGGPGSYLEPLVRHGFDPWLCDLSDANVASARARATTLGLSDVERRVRQSDATNLKHYARASFDAALALGPFYHLLDDAARRRAVSEIVRVVKPGGTIVLAVLPRLHPLRYLLREATAESFSVLQALDWDALLTSGRFENEEFFTDAYLTDLAEFRAMLRRARCRVIETLSAESFCSFMDVPLCEWATSEEKYTKLLELVDKTARHPEQIASAEHVLVVARTHGRRRRGPPRGSR
jgi:SAM-dependent methyltransferase